MAVSTTVSRNNYLGAGNLSVYTYTFQILNAADLRVATRDEDGVVDELTLGPDFTVTGVGGNSGTVTLLAGNLPTGVELVIMHDPEFLQEFRFNNLGVNYYPERHEKAYDRNVRYSQVLKEEINRAIKFAAFDAPFNATLPKLIPDSIVRVNAAANGLILSGPGEFIGPAGPQGNPLFVGIGDPNDIMAWDPTPNPNDLFIDENGAFWKFNGTTWALTGDVLNLGETATAIGYSSRYSQTVNLTTLQDIVNYIFQFVYTPPSISLAGSGSNVIYEKGASVSGINLTASVVKRSNPTANVRFYRGVSLLDTQATGGISGSFPFNYVTAFTDTTSFTSQVDDTLVGSDGPTTVTSNTVTYTFVYPYYHGVGAAGLNGAQIAALTKNVIASSNNVNRSFTVNGSQKMYFAYPASYGDLTSILDVNNFETLGDWTKTTKSITGADASSQSYTCYEFNNYAVAGTYSYTFKR